MQTSPAGLDLATGGVGLANLIGNLAKAEAQKAQAEFERRDFQFRQKVADRQAVDAIRRGQLRAAAARRKSKKTIGAQRAALAAQGIEIGGSALDLLDESTVIGELNQMMIRDNAAREALGLNLNSVSLGLRADVARISGRAESRATALTGGIQFARSLVDIEAQRQERTRSDQDA